ncbi:hypothetical protein ACGFIW_28660 [Micromonospora sp. NPDC048935]|uniref:DUF7657 domain-containing protein n=1 Tax=Micromonospora sp. NPDC048935 TaxID=3364262 RepID=UPI0037244DE0
MNDDTGPRGRTTRAGGRFVRGIWLFPALLTVVLLGLTALQINGSSVGMVHTMFYGTQPDPDLLFNNPQGIRADEWNVNTQITVAQEAANYPRINPNVGQGEDISLIRDVPYKEWSAVFKPHNLAFLVLPFDFAFAFKWWLMGYLLILSCYFFVLALMPGQRWFAAGLGLALFFSPFAQWWYQYVTLSSMYYALFAATALILLMRSKRLLTTIGWGALLAYVLTCFALVLYPPFQVACALAVAPFAVGFLIEQRRALPGRLLLRQLSVVVASLAVAGALIGAFVATRMTVIETIQNTAYPGKRVVESGNFAFVHLFSGHTSLNLQFSAKAELYKVMSNQSENSNFLLVFPFLVVPSVFLLIKLYRAQRIIDWPLLLVSITLLGSLVWLFVPNLELLGKILFLNLVPHARLLIGIGLLSFVGVVLFVRRLLDERLGLPSRKLVIAYTLVVLLAQALLTLQVERAFPDYMQDRGLVLSLIPIPLVVFLLLRRRFAWGAAVLLVFSVAMTAFIHPLYRGTEVLTRTPLAESIRAIEAEDPDASWAIESGGVQNFAYMNGARSLSGVYGYPQLDLWRTADPQGEQDFIYNRYAHVWFVFDRDPAKTVPTKYALGTSDHFEITTEPCGDFLRQHQARYLLTVEPLNEPCLELRETVRYPAATFQIYKVR